MSRQVCEIASRFDARRQSSDWLRTIELAGEVYERADPKRPGADFLRLARKKARMARKAVEQGNADAASYFAMGALQAAWQAEIADGRVMIDLGVKSYRRTQGENDGRSVAAAEDRVEWQRRANAVWRRHPAWSACRVATEIDPARWNTIRRHIKKK